MSIEIGISGWRYDGWRGSFYPRKLPHKDELKYASSKLPTIEINGTFYSIQSPKNFKNWYAETPKNFVFSVKANRYITHIKKLNDIEIPMANFFASGILELKEKLGPILWQFPPAMIFNPEKFEHFLKLLPRNVKEATRLCKQSTFTNTVRMESYKNRRIRHAVEIRNNSFLDPLFIKLLRKYQVALVFADTAGRWPYMEDLTSDFVYVRLHGDEELYTSGYDDQTLNFWKERIKIWEKGKRPKDQLTLLEEHQKSQKRDVFVYFDNDAKVRAPEDAASLIQKITGPEIAA